MRKKKTMFCRESKVYPFVNMIDINGYCIICGRDASVQRFRGPVFKASGWLQSQLSLLSFRDPGTGEYQELLGTEL